MDLQQCCQSSYTFCCCQVIHCSLLMLSQTITKDIHLYIASNVHETDDNSHSQPKSSVIIGYKHDGMDEKKSSSQLLVENKLLHWTRLAQEKHSNMHLMCKILLC